MNDRIRNDFFLCRSWNSNLLKVEEDKQLQQLLHVKTEG
jgi:hypothetical protein